MDDNTKNHRHGSSFDLDRTDFASLAELARDGRLSVTELAARVGLSKTPRIWVPAVK